jgi:hypothetical protein
MEVLIMRWTRTFVRTIGTSLLAVVLGLVGFDGRTAEPDRPRNHDEPEMRSETVTKSGVTLTIECPETLVSGAENYVTITLRNDGDEPIGFYPATRLFPAPGFEVSRAGKPVKITALGQRDLVAAEFNRRHTVRLTKGQEIRAVVNVPRYFDLSLIARNYQIVAMWDGYIIGKERLQIRTRPLHFEVKLKPGESVVGAVLTLN